MAQTGLLNRIRGKRLSHILAFLRAHLSVHRILKTIDLDQFKLYQERYKDADPHNEGYSKYLDVRTWMTKDLINFYLLNLHKSRPLRILDLGTGAGYFPYICSLYGHKVVAIDLDIVPMYNELCQFFHVDRRTWRIVKFENLPDLGVKFDLVTAFMIKFNLHAQADEWRVNEWKFFLEDLQRNQLVENGRILLSFNASRDETYYHDNELRNFFIDIGGRVYHRYVEIGDPKPNNC